MRRSLPSILLASIFWLTIVPAQKFPANEADEGSQYTLSNGAAIRLSADWAPRVLPHVPPPASLASSAPPLNFYDFQVFQNAADHSQVEFALSNNLLLGRDAYWLDGEMHRPPASGAGMVSYLFYFFFPPPPSCPTALRRSTTKPPANLRVIPTGERRPISKSVSTVSTFLCFPIFIHSSFRGP
jgi:hypothetical protein